MERHSLDNAPWAVTFTQKGVTLWGCPTVLAATRGEALNHAWRLFFKTHPEYDVFAGSSELQVNAVKLVT